MKVLVTGGRDFIDKHLLFDALDELHQNSRIAMVIHGGARGADLLADVWADLNDVPRTRFAADWNKDGKAAGPMRNRRMLAEGKPDLVVAFPGGKGTADMKMIARRKGVKVYESTEKIKGNRKVIVTGPAKFSDGGLLTSKLDSLLRKIDKKKLTLVVGHGDPVAHLVEPYAYLRRITLEIHRPEKGNSFAMVSVMHEDMAKSGAGNLVCFGEDEGNRDLIVRARKYGCKIKKVVKK